MVNLKSFPDGKSVLLTMAYRDEGGVRNAKQGSGSRGSGAYRDDGNETLGPRSRNAFEIVRTLWFIYEFLLRVTVSF